MIFKNGQINKIIRISLYIFNTLYKGIYAKRYAYIG